MRSWHVQPARALSGEVGVPGDKSIGHRAVLFAALADGVCAVRGPLGRRGQPAHGRGARRARRAHRGRARRRRGRRVHGVGLDGLRRAGAPLDCGNSGTSIRLLAGLLAGAAVRHDARRRRVPDAAADAARGRAAGADGRAHRGAPGAKPGEVYPPLVDRRPSSGSRGIAYDLPVASAQVKSAILLAGALRRRADHRARAGPDARSHRAHAAPPWARRSPPGGRRVVVDPAAGTGRLARAALRRPRRSVVGGVPARGRRPRRRAGAASPCAASASTRRAPASSTRCAAMGAPVVVTRRARRGRRAGRRPRRLRASALARRRARRRPRRSARSTSCRSSPWWPRAPRGPPSSATPPSCASRSPIASPTPCAMLARLRRRRRGAPRRPGRRAAAAALRAGRRRQRTAITASPWRRAVAALVGRRPERDRRRGQRRDLLPDLRRAPP